MSAATATGTLRFGALRRALRRVPAACAACAAIGFAHAAVWAVVTPPFQVPDETSHLGYVQYLAETGKLPSGEAHNSGEQEAAIQGIPFSIEGKPSWFPSDRRRLFRSLDKPRAWGDRHRARRPSPPITRLCTTPSRQSPTASHTARTS